MIKITREIDVNDVVEERNLGNVTVKEFSSYEGYGACFAAAAIWLQENVDHSHGGTLIGLDYYTGFDEGTHNLYVFIDGLGD